jgi:hypothetical protein
VSLEQHHFDTRCQEHVLECLKKYLGAPMDQFEYLRIPIKLIPLEIITQYALLPLVSDGHIYIEVQKGMYGLTQAGILANLLLAKRLAPHGYRQTKSTPSLWAHDTLSDSFSLVFDDFGVKYEGLANAHHLINALEQHYTVSKDWTGALYYGIILHRDYLHRHVDLSMPVYITVMLHKYQHPLPSALNMLLTPGHNLLMVNTSIMPLPLTIARQPPQPI